MQVNFNQEKIVARRKFLSCSGELFLSNDVQSDGGRSRRFHFVTFYMANRVVRIYLLAPYAGAFTLAYHVSLSENAVASLLRADIQNIMSS